jgi:hypothetical protein
LLFYELLFLSRDEKRYHEKQNKSERARRKKEDNARLRKLVDLVLKRDVRIARFKQQEKADREAAKLAKDADSRRAKEEALRVCYFDFFFLLQPLNIFFCRKQRKRS